MEQNKSCITINCGCCNRVDSGSSPKTGDGAPVGAVISYMGTKAPQHYLICDGTILNIADYPHLTMQIGEEFGAVNFFGGDGVTSFSLPDLRNEFLRGYHGEAAEQLSGEVGEHQEATSHTNVCGNGNATIFAHDLPHFGTNDSRNADSINRTNKVRYVSATNTLEDVRGYDYTSRPTNVTVLYCIKYEPA